MAPTVNLVISLVYPYLICICTEILCKSFYLLAFYLNVVHHSMFSKIFSFIWNHALPFINLSAAHSPRISLSLDPWKQLKVQQQSVPFQHNEKIHLLFHTLLHKTTKEIIISQADFSFVVRFRGSTSFIFSGTNEQTDKSKRSNQSLWVFASPTIFPFRSVFAVYYHHHLELYQTYLHMYSTCMVAYTINSFRGICESHPLEVKGCHYGSMWSDYVSGSWIDMSPEDCVQAVSFPLYRKVNPKLLLRLFTKDKISARRPGSNKVLFRDCLLTGKYSPTSRTGNSDSNSTEKTRCKHG